ncbi:MAG TPA: DUF378 domain-containing protein [Candidatus Pacearchaeota archaeon]|nr:DUF378 domain-containing protein [Candidatus Parcubacteria bacterium]HNZ83800.1 DUF378 domain-containing protein [Candidatus Pacearchaeota archaeon]HOU46043.1 DUF378 domain-containing protein [Candidatus Pacearchaeota archaeon]HPM08701.1 DUF378 domain-containing protein [Candidatus Pacearchaeota archaeon]HQI74818.1 DUF378 domain-containing protein [Candidatus Pacearchaeota archaeon]
MFTKILKFFLIIGGINWLIVGLMKQNLVEKIFGGIPMLVTITYVIVGIAAIFELLEFFKK